MSRARALARVSLICIGLATATLVYTPGCSPLPSVVDAEDFELEIRDFNWEVGGSELLSISATGEARYVYIRSSLERWPLERPDAQGRTEQEVLVPHWYEVTWTPSAAQLRELQRLIDDQRILGLDDHYRNRMVSDGWQRVYTLRALGQTKQITCSNHAPRAIRALDDHVAQLRPGDGNTPLEGERELSKAELEAEGLI